MAIITRPRLIEMAFGFALAFVFFPVSGYSSQVKKECKISITTCPGNSTLNLAYEKNLGKRSKTACFAKAADLRDRCKITGAVSATYYVNKVALHFSIKPIVRASPAPPPVRTVASTPDPEPLPASSTTRPASASSNTVAASCRLGNKTIRSGQYLKVYRTANLPDGKNCNSAENSEKRYCRNGKLSGNFTALTCAVDELADCHFNSQKIVHGDDVVAYLKPSGSSNLDCQSSRITRTCQDGVLDGNSNYKYAYCQVYRAPATIRSRGQKMEE